MFVLDELKVRMSEMGISPNKLLGQNFLVSETVINRIVEAATNSEFEKHIEVGPGPGALTDRLELKGVKPQLIEMDRKIVEYWESRDFEVIQGDALKQDWQTLCSGKKTCFVSNLPYQISSTIVIDRSVETNTIDRMILMFQKEVAQRIIASHGGKDYGLLTVMAQSYWDISKVTEAGPKDFYPPPKVASRVLQFEKKKCDVDGKKLLRIVKASFAQRRKKLTKNLNAVAGLDKDKVKSLLEEWGLPEGVRAEQLSVEQYHGLVSALD